MPLTTDAKGVYPSAPTSFFDDGGIDTLSIDCLVGSYRASGFNGIMVLGQLGEAPKLERFESVDIAAKVVRRSGTVLVAVGVLAPGFAAMRALARDAMGCGAIGVMIAPPNMLGTDDQMAGDYWQAGMPRSEGLAASGMTGTLSSKDGRRPFLELGQRPRSKP